jgi:tetratricopeptide (TPR) repeat protein
LCISCAFPRILVLDDPLSPEEHINLGVTYETEGDVENALKEYTKASKKLPLAFLYIGNTYYNKGDFDIAEAYYKKAIDNDPAISDAYNNLAWLYYIKKENLDKAELLVLKAIELNPQKKDMYIDTLEKIRQINTREN